MKRRSAKMQEQLKVVHLCTYDYGGAGTAAYRLHKGLRSAGINSTMLVLENKSKDPSVKALTDSPSGKHIACSDICINGSPLLARQKRRWFESLSRYPNRPAGLELFTDAVSDVRLNDIKEIQDADIINLHWVAGMVDYHSLPLTLGEKPVVWTLHDMNPFTGGCHYAGDCINYKTSCGMCPQLASCDTDDLSQKIWNCKYDVYKGLKLNIVTPSRWLAECASASALFSPFHADVIPNGLPTDVFKPYSKTEIRKILNIPQDARVILFGAHSVLNRRKGFEYLLAAMNNFSLKSEAKDIIFTLFGIFSASVEIKTKYPICSLGTITDENNLAKIYSMADVFVIPSLEDNLPNTVIEAMACGLPVVGFDIGGIPDMIEHKRTGYLVSPRDINGLIEGINWLVSSPDNGANFSRQCREKVLKQFSLEGQAQAYIELYKRSFDAENSKKATACSKDGQIHKKLLKLENKQNNRPKNKFPKISIVTPSYNQGEFLEECINSILSQNYPNLEYIIMDGGSTDNSVEIIRKYEKYLTYWQSKPDAGQYPAIEEGFKRTTGEIMAWLNSDDKYHPDSLFRVAYIFGKHPNVEWITSRPTGWNEKGKLADVGPVHLWSRKSYIQLGRKIFIQQESTFWKRTLWEKAGAKLETDLSFAGDSELWVRFFRHTQLFTVDALLGGFRHHSGQKTKLCMDKYFQEAEQIIKQEIANINKARPLYLPPAPKPIRLNRKEFQKYKENAFNVQQIQAAESSKQPPDYLHAEYQVSIVVCTKDRAELLDRMLVSLKDAIKGVACEIIVVEGGCRDNTLDILRKHHITKVYNEQEWLGQGRHSWPQLYNFGFSKATGKWAMYASDDIIFGKGCISQAVDSLNKQPDNVAGGIFFYKNIHPTNPQWAKYGIDFTHGSKLLMNYGLVRLDHFREVGGLDESYQFYCADTDLCYKLYQAGKQFIVMPNSFIAHDNILDEQKMANMDISNRDIELCQQRWIHFVPTELPNPRRLFWQEEFFDALALQDDLEKINSGIEYYWHGLACFQQELFEQAKAKFRQAVDSGLDRAKDFLSQLDYADKATTSKDNHQDNLTVLLFSKDRAMQLQAAIESFFLHCADSDKAKLHVLYSPSNQLHRRQYDKLKEKFDNISFVEQTNFKEQLLSIIDNCEYVLFMVDDNLFVRDFHLSDIFNSLRSNPDSAGFSLRLGKNTSYCYPRNTSQTLPQFQQLDGGILKYDWTQAEFDFGYPLEVSSSVYRVADIHRLLAQLEFDNPNLLESLMAANARLYTKDRANLLCYEYSVAFCNPINIVQSVWANRAGTNHKYSVDSLAQLFDEGTKIDIERYSSLVTNACHEEVELHFKHIDETAADKPKFSIVMSNYNKSAYIAQAIDSVINQTFRDWELIIVDDCSSDNSRQIIERYLGDRRIKLICHDSNHGIPSSAKTAIENVHSEYFGILDSDDALVPHAVETMYKEHIKFPDCGLIYSQFTVCSEALTPKCKGSCGPIPAGKTSLDVDLVSHFKTFKMRDYLKTPGYDVNLPCAEDKDIIHKMEEVTRLKFVDECLYLYRQLPTAQSHADGKVNLGIMCRVKARLNALKRRCTTLAGSENHSFENLFRHAVNEARTNYEDVEQYFVLLSKLYEDGLLGNLNLPQELRNLSAEDVVWWLAANVDIDFERLFDLLNVSKAADRYRKKMLTMLSIGETKNTVSSANVLSDPKTGS